MFEMKPIVRSLALALGGAGVTAVVAPVALAQQQSGQQMERVEITGSAIRRIEGETALPVTIIKADELRARGLVTAEQVVTTITSSMSFANTSGAIGASTGGGSFADMRGLGPNKTLVLLNGRRVANLAFPSNNNGSGSGSNAGAVDLNTLPLAAVDRIEVLRDGASAIYGTDAVGGVINFILRRDYQGISVNGGYESTSREGGGDSYNFGGALGFGSLETQKFNVMGVFDYRHQNAVPAINRNFAKTGIRPDLGVDPAVALSGTPFPANYQQTQGATTVSGNPSYPGCQPPLAIPNPPSTCVFDFSGLIDIIPDQTQSTALVRGTVALGAQNTAYVEYFRSENDVITRVAPTPVTGITMPNTSPYYPGNGIYAADPALDPTQPISLRWRTLPAGQRTDEARSVGQRLLANLDGSAGGWDYRAGVWQSKNTTSQSFLNGYVRRSDIQAGLTSGILNPFGDQTPDGNAALQAAKLQTKVIDSEGKVTGVDARVSGDLAQLPAGPLSLATGAEYREEKYNYALVVGPDGVPIAFQAVSSGLEGAQPTNGGSRKVTGVFGELAIPIIQHLDASFALRFDHYNDVGNTTNPKFSLRYQPVNQLLLRGSYAKGFRAPTLFDIYSPLGTTNTAQTWNDPVLCPNGPNGALGPGGVVARDCGQQFNALTGGPTAFGGTNKDLEPEKSNSYTLGFVLQPTDTLAFTVDYWDVRVKNFIGGVPEQAIFGDPARYAANFVRCGSLSLAQINANPAVAGVCLDQNGNNQAQVLAYITEPTKNLGEQHVSGFDVDATYRILTGGAGAFTFNLQGTYLTKWEQQLDKGGPFYSALGQFSPQLAFPAPKWKHVLTAGWSIGPWGLTLDNRYISGYKDQNDPSRMLDPTYSRNVSAWSIWDFFVAFQGVKNLTVIAGVKNLADKDPPASNQGATFQQGYEPRIHSPMGRLYTTRLEYKFY